MAERTFDAFMDRAKEMIPADRRTEVIRAIVRTMPDRDALDELIGVDDELLAKAREALERDPETAAKAVMRGPRPRT